MASPLLKFNTYTLPSTFYIDKRPTNRSVPSAKLPRADGARVITGYLEGKTFSLKGGLIGGSETLPTSSADLRAQLDTLKAALASGPANFQTADDRYWRNCQISNFEEMYSDTAFGRYAEIAFDVITGDPFAYEVATQSVTAAGSSLVSLSCTAGGNVYALPAIKVTASASSFTLTVTNTTNGDVCTVNGLVTSGDVIVVDSLNSRVYRLSDGADRMSLFDGIFPRLNVGANALTIAVSSGSISAASAGWQNRYW